MATNLEKTTAVLLIAHGSRRTEANDELETLADEVRKRTTYPIVETAYLEIAEPTIPQGAKHCVEQGASCVLMLPYFLSPGSHVVDDLQRHSKELYQQFPAVTFRLCPPLGLHPLMINIILDHLNEPHIG